MAKRLRRTKAQVQERRDAVEEVLLTGRWCSSEVRRLAEIWEVTRSNIRADRVIIIESWKIDLAAVDRETQKAVLLQEIRALRSASASAGLTRGDPRMVSQAVQLIHLEATILGLDKPQPVEQGAISIADPDAIASEVLALIPFAAGILGLDGPVAVIDAASWET